MECTVSPDTPPAGAPAKTPAFFDVEVTRVHHWSDSTFTLCVTRPDSFRFRSGEFVMLGMNFEKPLLRAYSIVSSIWAEELEFLSIKVADGPLTRHLQHVKPGDRVLLGRKPTGTLVIDALRPGRRLFMLATGTGLAPFLSVVRDPDAYRQFDELVVVHSVRNVADLAYREMLESRLADDPLVGDEAALQLTYLPIVTREPWPLQTRITTLIESETLTTQLGPDAHPLDPHFDRVMICGSMAMLAQTKALLESRAFAEGSNNLAGDYVVEKAFVA
jgi:ferredoxin/flavodoxin---NADP+ reductase